MNSHLKLLKNKEARKKYLDFVLAMVIWQEKDFNFCDICQNITCNLHDFNNY